MRRIGQDRRRRDGEANRSVPDEIFMGHFSPRRHNFAGEYGGVMGWELRRGRLYYYRRRRRDGRVVREYFAGFNEFG
jgi:hypothetical protein